VQKQERPDTGTRICRSVLEGPGMEAPRDEVADKVEEGKAAAGGRLDDLDEVEQAAREAEQESWIAAAALTSSARSRGRARPGSPACQVGSSVESPVAAVRDRGSVAQATPMQGWSPDAHASAHLGL